MNLVSKLSPFGWWIEGPGLNMRCCSSGHSTSASSHLEPCLFLFFSKFVLLCYNVWDCFFVRHTFDCVLEILRVPEKNWQNLTIRRLGKCTREVFPLSRPMPMADITNQEWLSFTTSDSFSIHVSHSHCQLIKIGTQDEIYLPSLP